MKKINITDLKKLKITKVRPWKIYFKYENKNYMLISENEDEHISFFEREISNGKIRLHFINSTNTWGGIQSFIKDISKHAVTNVVYTNIDKEFFVKKLIALDLVCGIYSTEYTNTVNKMQNIQDEIDALQKRINDLKTKSKEYHNKYFSTAGHGSKCYGDKFRIQQAERIEGAKDGDYCAQYNDFYGNTHPKYGGTLTDLYNLPVSTHFHVANGCYDAIISFDEKGNKCVVTDVSCRELTEECHSLYITNVKYKNKV